MFIARSISLYPDYVEDITNKLYDEIIIPSYYLNILMDDFEDDAVLYTTMTNIDKDLSYLVTIGSPHTYDKNTIYVPQWILDIIGCSGNCDSVITIKKADITDIPAATKIIIKPLDPIAFELDTLSCFEKALIDLHSIREDITIPIQLSDFNNQYTIFAHIDKVEPSPLSRIIEGEVDVEFINIYTTSYDIDSTASIHTSESVHTDSNILQNSPNSADRNDTTIHSNTTEQNSTVQNSTEQNSLEERRRQIRESWTKHFQNTSSAQ